MYLSSIQSHVSFACALIKSEISYTMAFENCFLIVFTAAILFFNIPGRTTCTQPLQIVEFNLQHISWKKTTGYFEHLHLLSLQQGLKWYSFVFSIPFQAVYHLLQKRERPLYFSGFLYEVLVRS